jgi:hypothetical protein
MKARKGVPTAGTVRVTGVPAESDETSFADVVRLIEQARERAYQAVNKELVGLYWQVGKYISGKLESAEWGDGVVDRLAQHLFRTLPGLRGFTRRNLFRMRQFYETYAEDEKVSPLVTQLPWTHHLLEALDRDVRKPHENPAIGVLLCASKEREVVEYALSRSLSPALIAAYQTQLPDKQLLQAKLHEFYQHTLAGQEPTSPATGSGIISRKGRAK